MSTTAPIGATAPELRPSAGAAPVDGAPQRTVRLGLLIGSRHWLADLSQAGEFAPLPESIAPVPLTRDWLVGLANLRGTLYTVVDLGRFAGFGRTPTGKDSRLLTFGTSLRLNASIVVTRVFGLRDLATMRGEDAAAADHAFHPRERPFWVERSWRDGEGVLWHELDLARLAASEVFMSVGR